MRDGHRSKDAMMVEDIPAARAEERVARRILRVYGLQVRIRCAVNQVGR